MAFRPKKRGFTLIELMLVVAIIGLLAAIAVPRFADMITKAKEASIKGKLGTLRSAVTLYYANNEGFYPRFGGTLHLLLADYLDDLPVIGIPTAPSHNPGYRVTTVGLNWAGAPGGATVNNALWDPNFDAANPWPWGYGAVHGTLVVACTHTDSRGQVWSLQ